MRRAGALTLVALASAVLAAAPATAAIKRAKDRKAGVTFRLNAKHLTMKLSDQADPRVAKKVLGKRVAAACGTNKTTGGSVYDAVFEWPADRASVAVDLERDISRRAAYCLLETTRGADIAVVEFK
jgi:hypothetical protein